MEIFESLVEVKHGSTTLVSIGDPMWETARVNGQQVVQQVPLFRAAGIKARPRRNDANVVTLSIAVEAATIEDAEKASLTYPTTLPKTMQDVTILFSDESGVRVKNASIESWDCGQVETIGRHALRIIGGELEHIAAPTPP